MKSTCVDSAAVRLMLQHPFWTELYYSMRVIEDPSIKTLMTDGERMWVNPEFWKTLTNIDHKVTALAHESCHKMLHHCTRGLDFIPQFAQIAADIVVNTLLAECGFKIHPHWIQPEPKYSNWTFEAIYRDLTKDLPPPPPQGGGDGGDDPKGGDDGDGDDDGNSFYDKLVAKKYQGAWQDIKRRKGTPAEIEKFEREVEQTVAKAIASAQGIGTLPAGIAMAANKVIKITKEPWYNHLQRFMQALRTAEYNWAKQSKRMAVCHRIVAPDIYSEALGECWVFIDASGSCYIPATQANFTMHVNGILAEAKPQKLHACYFDVGVHKHVEIDPGELELDTVPVGGGGTSFVELFEYIEQQGGRPDVVIILTDMYGTFPAEPPPYPVIWASVCGVDTAPFGDVILVEA